MDYNWNWEILLCLSAGSSPSCQQPYLLWILSGLGWTVAVALCAWIIAFPLGSIIGIMRTINHPIPQWIAAIYISIFRNIPLLVQMFLWFFVVPEIVSESVGYWLKRELPLPEFWTAVICLGTYTSARVSEQIRAGIGAISIGQHYAAMAIGLRPLQVYRYILLPVGYRTIIPPMTSEFMGVFKNSSLALTIGVIELTAQARQIEEHTFQGFEAFTAATLLYICLTTFVLLVMRYIESRFTLPGMVSLGVK